MPASEPVRLLIAFYSRSGSVETLAVAAAEAARAAGATVRLRRAREVVDNETMAKVEGWAKNAERQNALYEAPTHEDAEWADAILFGTPSYFGAMATELKAFLDQLGPQWKRGAFGRKGGRCFRGRILAPWGIRGGDALTLRADGASRHGHPTDRLHRRGNAGGGLSLWRLGHCRCREPRSAIGGSRRHTAPEPAHGGDCACFGLSR